MKAPKEIYLNINDEDEMPPLDEIDWSEVCWTRDRPALRQALLYVILEDRDSIIAESYEKDAEIEQLRSDWRIQNDRIIEQDDEIEQLKSALR